MARRRAAAPVKPTAVSPADVSAPSSSGGHGGAGLPAAGKKHIGQGSQSTPPLSPDARPFPPPAHSAHPHGPPGPPPKLSGFHRLRVALRFSPHASIDEVCESAVYDLARVANDRTSVTCLTPDDPSRPVPGVRYFVAGAPRRQAGDDLSYGPKKGLGKRLSGLNMLHSYLVKLGVAFPEHFDLDAVCDSACDKLHDMLSKPVPAHHHILHVGFGQLTGFQP